MKTGFYVRLAVSNLRKNSQTYIPYILTCIMTIMMFYMIKSLALNPGIEKMVGANIISYIMELGSQVIGLFAFIFLFYTNSFLMKRRKKEFGLFNILGMEKKHLSMVLFLETLFTAAVALSLGLVLGIALDKAMFLLIMKVIGGGVSLGFFISAKAIRITVIVFGILFLLIYLKSVYTIRVSNPIELLRGGNVGEKEPKAKWLLAIIGSVILGAGYYIALTIKNPITSIFAFFGAVILVIIATYLLFTSGSITVLKLLRKNQRFYYRSNHFISVSGMIYRMKQNAVGLANICILSTMVLVMVSSTTSLMVGIEDIIHTRYPNDFSIYSQDEDFRNQEIFREADAICQELDVSVSEKIQYSYVSFSLFERGDTFVADGSLADILVDQNALQTLVFIPLSDYNMSTGENRELGVREMLFYSNREKYTEPVINLFDTEYSIVGRLEQFFGNGVLASYAMTSYYCIVRDEDFYALIQTVSDELGIPCVIDTYYGFDVTAGETLQQEIMDRLTNAITSFQLNGYLESRLNTRISFMGLYGGLFFLGIFLGTVFIMATVLIIYYKQISEGYEDRERFVIMQKVGMTKTEVKNAIHSQVLTVFFLPLIVAGIHVAVAFPAISVLLSALNMTNVRLYLICTAVCFLVFMVMYVLIYSLTAKTYYKIVSR